MVPSKRAYGTAPLTPPKTPLAEEAEVQVSKTRGELELTKEFQDKTLANSESLSRTDTEGDEFDVSHQQVLLLHGPKQRYIHTTEQAIPSLANNREMLVQVQVVGLNPIDWKAPDFGYGLPVLPCISGRDLAGKVVKISKGKSRFKKGDRVMGISTDYRDSRKAAYQEYAVVSDFNACKIPHDIASTHAAGLGVAFVAAALALGICLGIDFSSINGGVRGPDILSRVRSLPRDSLPKDITAECFEGIGQDERAKAGDWIAIWGGSSATGCCAVQLAKLAGLRVISIIDVARSGERMLRHGADLLVDRLDTDRAISIVNGISKGKLRFGLDTRGRESATLLAKAMQKEDSRTEKAHLVGLTGLPKESIAGVVYHSVPIKAFHEEPRIGEDLMLWLEELLAQNLVATPEIEVAEGGLQGINAALDRLRDGTVNGPRIVVPLRP